MDQPIKTFQFDALFEANQYSQKHRPNKDECYIWNTTFFNGVQIIVYPKPIE